MARVVKNTGAVEQLCFNRVNRSINYFNGALIAVLTHLHSC